MLRNYPGTLRWRQGLPPLFVAGVILLVLLSFWVWARWLLAVGALVYFAVLLTAGLLQAVRRSKFHYLFSLPLALIVMHFSWGGGFLWSMISFRGQRKNG